MNTSKGKLHTNCRCDDNFKSDDKAVCTFRFSTITAFSIMARKYITALSVVMLSNVSPTYSDELIKTDNTLKAEETNEIGKFKELAVGELDGVVFTYDELDVVDEYPEHDMYGRPYAVELDSFAPFGRIGSENRDEIKDKNMRSEHPYTSIVYLDNSIGHVCTGFFVSSTHILTAAHCIHTGSINGRILPKLEIHVQRRRSFVYQICVSVSTILASEYVGATSTLNATMHDYALIKVNCVEPQETWFDLSPQTVQLVSQSDIAMQGYMTDDDLRKMTQYYSPGYFDIRIENKGFYDNDSSYGTSGSPVFDSDENRIALGVHSTSVSSDEEPWSKFNSFTFVSGPIASRILGWIE